ncbi:MAG: HEAT repeat domain-containing protein [Verrucomicrobiota bacterium]
MMITKRSFLTALALGVLALNLQSAHAAKPKSEDELIASLADKDPKKVAESMLQLEKQYPTSTRMQAEIKKYLTDPRDIVRRKAGRVLGALHAEVSDADLKHIAAMLKGTTKEEVMDALKSLRGLKSQSVIPEIVALLQNSEPNIVRDACRTLGEIGTKANVPSLEPLLKSADPKVQKDAQDAIFKLNSRS